MESNIQANELRVGNILQYTTAEGDKMFTSIDWQDLKWIDEDEKGFNSVHDRVLLTEEILLKCPQLKQNPISIIQFSYYLDLGRNKILSLSDIGLGNEMICLCEIDAKDKTKITNVIFLHNIDYDGRISLNKFQNIVFDLTGKELEINL